MKVIDTESFLSMLCELATEGNRVCTVISGGSMIPFLSPERDFVYLEKPPQKLRKGDIALFRRKNGDYVLHRIKAVKKDGLYLIGDRQYAEEGPISFEQVCAVAVGAKRKGKEVTVKSPVWLFYSRIWINLVFARPFLFKVAEHMRRKNKA